MNVWQRTRVPNLLRHEGGRYYGRFTIAGKQKFIALETRVLEVAKIRLSEHRTKIERSRQSSAAVKGGTCCMGDLLILFKDSIAGRVDLSVSTRERYEQLADYLPKTWPGFNGLRPDEIRRSAVEAWRSRALSEGTGYKPPKAKGKCSGTSGRSAGTFNKAFDVLRRLLDIAVERGAVHGNPLMGRGFKAKNVPRKPQLPDSKVLLAVFDEIEKGSGIGGWGLETADFCRFLALTGCRLQEANRVHWCDVDFVRGVLRVQGTKTEAASREVPLIPSARTLLVKIQERRLRTATVAIEGKPYIDPASRVLGVKEANKSLARACSKLGIERLTHHDMRDGFATAAIEAGVDIPTVAAWLGHADGGALLMRVYAHHRRAHSITQAAKVNF